MLVDRSRLKRETKRELLANVTANTLANMPIVSIETSVALDEKTANAVLTAVSKAVASALGKPESVSPALFCHARPLLLTCISVWPVN